MAHALRWPEPAPTPCGVCGLPEVATDVVEAGTAGGRLWLAECPRCDHRWTAAEPPLRLSPDPRPMLRPLRKARRALREGASAA